MTDKHPVKHDQGKDRSQKKDTSQKDDVHALATEVIEDLDLPNKDEDAIRGGCIRTAQLCGISHDTY